MWFLLETDVSLEAATEPRDLGASDAHGIGTGSLSIYIIDLTFCPPEMAKLVLAQFLKAIGNTGRVRLEFKDAQSAVQMRPEDANEDVKYRYILMPMRI